MKAKVITMRANTHSETAADRCIDSGRRFSIEVEKFYGCLHTAAHRAMQEYGIRWNYPWNGDQVLDMQTGILKTGYTTAVKEKRIACFFSHYYLWKECAESGEDYIILEHDAEFERMVPLEVIERSQKTIIGLNRPQPGCTPKADIYINGLNHQVPTPYPPARVLQIPYIQEDMRHPAGLPGNSAYYIKPRGAEKMLKLVEHYGAWPNDALMCKQLLPKDLGIVWPAATRVNQQKSTTTL